MPGDDGFFLPLLAKRDAVETCIQQCYSQIFTKMGYLSGQTQVSVDGAKKPLNADTLSTNPDDKLAGRESFYIIRQVFVKTFADGSVLVKLIKDALTALGKDAAEVEAKEKANAGKNNGALRTAYWYIERNFVSRLPPLYQVGFAVDCMMFGNWQCSHSNVIAMHLVLLAAMMDVKQFIPFLPPEVAKQAIVTAPPLKGFLEKKAIVLAINPAAVAKTAPAGAGAGVAKAVDKKPPGGDDKSKAGKDKKAADDKGGKDKKAADDKGKGGKDKKADDKGKGGKDKKADDKGKDKNKGKDAKKK